MTASDDDLFPVEHLRELASLINREVRLPQSWETSVEGTMLFVARDEAEVTSSRGVAVVHTASTTSSGIIHALSLVTERSRALQPVFDELGHVVAEWLDVKGNVQPSANVTGVLIGFALSRRDEVDFQAKRLDVSDDQLRAAATRLRNAKAQPRGEAKPWWRFW